MDLTATNTIQVTPPNTATAGNYSLPTAGDYPAGTLLLVNGHRNGISLSDFTWHEDALYVRLRDNGSPFSPVWTKIVDS